MIYLDQILSGILIILCVASGGTANSTGEGRIVGGFEITILEAKYQISLRVKKKEKLAGFGQGHICGGSVIGQRLILTAAHCVQNYAAKELTVVMGNANRILADPLQLQYNVKEIIKHQAFDSVENTNDIALLFINGYIPWNWPTVQAIHLNTRKISTHTLCRISGWGDIKVGQQSMSLLAANVPIVSYEQCRSTYIHVPNSMICAGYFDLGGIDACQGDSGGPLVCNGLLAGIVSWGDGCAVAHNPGVYTNVSTFNDWILKANSSLNYTSYDGAASTRLNVCLSILIVFIFCMKIIF